MPPTIEVLSGFPWVDAQLQIPTGEFGSDCAKETFGAGWQLERPFLKAVVTKKCRNSKTNGQRWTIVVEYDSSEIKRDAQYMYDCLEDRDYLKDFLQPKLPVAADVVAAPSNDTVAPAVEDSPVPSKKPPQVIDKGAAATKVAEPSVPGSAAPKPVKAKKRRRRPKSIG